MHRPRRLLALCGLFALCCCGCAEDDTDRLSRVWHRLGERVETLTAGLRQNLASGWSALRERSASPSVLRERVLARLQSDKALSASAIEVEVDGTAVTLRGQIADATVRQRAVELAQGTVGVEQVIDELGPKETPPPP